MDELAFLFCLLHGGALMGRQLCHSDLAKIVEIPSIFMKIKIKEQDIVFISAHYQEKL